MEGKYKRVPWTQFKEYVEIHQRQVSQLTTLEERGVMKADKLETIVPECLRKIHSKLTQILTENQIIDTPNQYQKEQIDP